MMPTDQGTVDKITSWASDQAGGASPSLASAASTTAGSASTTPAAATPAIAPSSDGLLAAAAAPSSTAATSSATTGGQVTPATTTPGSTTTTPGTSANVSDWYRAVLGRDGDAGGISYWQNALKNSGDPNGVYSDFQKAAATNNEVVHTGTTLDQANTYKGPASADGSTVVDDWGRNVLGRNLTSSELSTWKAKMNAATTPAAAQQVYSDFLAANQGQVKNNMSISSASQIASGVPNSASGTTPYTLNQSDLAVRTIDKPTETVQGQLGSILAADNPVLQQARADGQRTAFDRGLGNSSIAASAGEDALIRAATGIATTDAGAYNNAANYNAAATNQMVMYNADQMNKYNELKMQYGDAEASRMMQQQLAQMQNATTLAGQAQQMTVAQMQNDTTRAGQAQQLTVAQMQDQTARWNTEQQTANSRYNTDTQYRQQVDNQKLGVANNIMSNADISPDRKAAMLEALGFGTSAKPGQPGTGLAGAVYVIDSTSLDLNMGGATIPGGMTGPVGSMMVDAATQARAGAGG